MARKKKPPEPENMERWMVSYADFMTLLFATFVVLYALSQTDISSFFKLQDSIRSSFSAGVLEGSDGMFNDGDLMVGSYDADSLLMMEYLSQAYEEQAFQDVKNEIDELKELDKDFEDVSVEVTDNGLVIKFTNSDMMFKPGSAELSSAAFKYLDKIGGMIREKFKVHLMKVEGHTDSEPIHTRMFPSNWELSSARASSVVRYLIKKFEFQPVLFSAVGLAEFRPVADNNTLQGRKLNRRVEITVLRNKHKKVEMGNSEALTQKVLEIEHMKLKNADGTLQKVKFTHLTPPLKKDEIIEDIVPKQEIIIFDDTYEKESKRLEEIQKANRRLFKDSK